MGGEPKQQSGCNASDMGRKVLVRSSETTIE